MGSLSWYGCEMAVPQLVHPTDDLDGLMFHEYLLGTF